MRIFASMLVAAPFLCFGYAYFVYPLLLKALASRRSALPRWGDPPRWPTVTISIPAYNEERNIRATIESLLAIDYPPDRRQILIMSDASGDQTDAIVREYADRGVELFRMPRRGGKTAAENAAATAVRGEIVVNTDATIRILPQSLKALVRVFQDPAVGVSSGRDVSIGDLEREGNRGESSYVGYEMWVRSLETRLGSIVGASGCLYGFRRELHDTRLPNEMTRDFACALAARARGFRTVSVDDAVCLVPRTRSLQAEYKRKIRTMAQGLQTLWYMRSLMNPFRYGSFALMLISHKLMRWLVYPALLAAPLGLALLGVESMSARWLLAAAGAGVLLGWIGMRWPEGRSVPRLIAVPGFILAANLAGVVAWTKLVRRERIAVWEPTRRPL